MFALLQNTEHNHLKHRIQNGKKLEKLVFRAVENFKSTFTTKYVMFNFGQQVFDYVANSLDVLFNFCLQLGLQYWF